MATTSELQASLASIDAILNAGIRQSTDDQGRSITYDLEALQRRRDEIVATLSKRAGSSRVRRVTLANNA